MGWNGMIVFVLNCTTGGELGWIGIGISILIPDLPFVHWDG
jgi:hypothetical protein